MKTLALNCGSSSLKFGVYEGERLLLEGEAEEIGGAGGKFWTRRSNQDKQETATKLPDHARAFALAMENIDAAELTAVGHRVVHGGPTLRDHVRLTQGVRRELDAAVDFAPLHLPSSLAVIDAVSKALPNIPQVVCLDTAFHKEMPDVAKTLPLPVDVRARGIERYGFHGLSLESIVMQLKTVPERMVIAHLGNGSSITAIHAGKSIDTSMGLTPTGGVMMGTRCGDIDPGVMIYLLRHGFDAKGLETVVDHASWLKGVSGTSSDVRELKSGDLALRMFCYQVRKTVAGMAAALGGLDALVFTGGIGEHSADVRNQITIGLDCLGTFELLVLASEEDLQIARITAALAV